LRKQNRNGFDLICLVGTYLLVADTKPDFLDYKDYTLSSGFDKGIDLPRIVGFTRAFCGSTIL